MPLPEGVDQDLTGALPSEGVARDGRGNRRVAGRSTGNGSLFVVEREEGRVLLLPPGPVRKRRYDGKESTFQIVALNVSQFLELLAADFEAFVNDDRGHVYLTDLGKFT